MILNDIFNDIKHYYKYYMIYLGVKEIEPDKVI